VSATTTTYTAVRITYDSELEFNETRGRFDERVPEFESATSAGTRPEENLMVRRAGRGRRSCRPNWLVALARRDQGALLSLEGTLYLVGNQILAHEVVGRDRAAALYAPFRVAIYGDATGVHVASDKPSSVFASLGHPASMSSPPSPTTRSAPSWRRHVDDSVLFVRRVKGPAVGLPMREDRGMLTARRWEASSRS
jgi:hypothetical protein